MLAHLPMWTDRRTDRQGHPSRPSVLKLRYGADCLTGCIDLKWGIKDEFLIKPESSDLQKELRALRKYCSEKIVLFAEFAFHKL